MSRFEKFHPITSFVYFMSVLLVAMLTMNPVVIVICYLSSILFGISIFGIAKMLKSLAYSIPLAVMMSVINPLFVHKGETILFFLNDNPITVEAIFYGIFASLMLMSVFYWCKSYSAVMTSDKTLYLFGSVLPKLGLIISMAIAFVPKFKRKYQEIDEAQKALGIYSGKSYVDKIRSKLRVFSILITLSLENSIDTADSMRARGYGLKKRTHYSIFKFTRYDLIFLILTLAFAVGTLSLIFAGIADFTYYPNMTQITITAWDIALYVTLILLTGISTLMEVKENLLWRYLKSKI